MNKKRKSFKVLFLAVCMIALMVIQPLKAEAASDVVDAEAYHLGNLLQEIEKASDGDVIGIMNSMLVEANVVIGDPNKHITLKRMNSSSYFSISSTTTFQNVTFDGDGISTPNAYVISNGNVTFQDSTFRNCITETANGGAVHIINRTVSFNNCTFDSNTGVQGGHIYAANTANVTIDNSTFENGYAISDGGAIRNASSSPGTFNITSSIIKDNSAGKFGGAISNNGNMKITGSKVYDNTAPVGADIANAAYANLNLADSIETLVTLFQDEGIVPTGWVNDYNAEAGVELPAEIIPTAINSLLKLAYEIPPTEVILDAASLGTAADGKITGLESGKYYKVTMGDVISYVKGDGTLTLVESEAEAEALLGTEIVGLTNGLTYKAEEYIPAPVEEEPTEPPVEEEPEEPGTVILDLSSLGTAGDGKISELTPGKTYKVIIIAYVKADGTLTSIESEAEPLNGTDILGLTNGKLYKVEEYAPVEPQPEPVEEPEQEQDNPQPTPEPQPQPDPEPAPVTPSTPSESSHRSSRSHSTNTVVVEPKPEPIVEQKPAVVLSHGKAVLDTTKNEYLLGYTDGLMGNKDTVTRAQLVQIVYRLLTPESMAAVHSEKNSFKDVASNAWYNEAVSSIANAGLISVGADGKFNPDKNVTWGEMVTILAKFAEPNSEWKIITRHWARDAINTAISYRWFEYNDQFNPDGEVTRLEMLNFINTMFNWTTK